MITVCNSSPLIGLAAIGLFDLFNALYGTIHIPEAVWQEVVVSGAGRPGSQEVQATSWIICHKVADQQAVAQLLTGGLDQGECEAIVLAHELNAALLILDDRKARRYVTDKQLTVIGTGGILLRAKDNQIIASVKPPLDALILAGLHIDPKLYQQILRFAGE